MIFLTWAKWSLDPFFGRYGVNKLFPTGIQLKSAHMYAAVESNVTSQTCKHNGALTLILEVVLTFGGCERMFFFFF